MSVFAPKRLNYYDLSDVSIFDGREADIERCARLILLPRTRLLLLHGSTGCGKSSFMRAGLIPFLETRELGYSFVRQDESELKAHFIRSTDDPLCRLAEGLFQIAGAKRVRRTPRGSVTIDLSSCIPQHALELAQFVRQSPRTFLEVLSCFSNETPETLVLIFDQIEEVLTLRPGQDGDDLRDRFFQFLMLYIDAEIDVKIVLALRTEYLGRLLDLLDYNILESGNVNLYLLKDLSDQGLIRAIVRPTSEQSYGNHGSPRQKYRFRFSPGVPQLMAQDLKRTLPAGGILPAMQLVCGRLYQMSLPRGENGNGEAVSEITLDHYRELGRVEGQINGYLTEALVRLCRVARVSQREVGLEVRRWRRTLLSLAKVQIDGTVTTEVRSLSLFTQDAKAAGCTVPPEAAIGHLKGDENLILREVDVYNAALKKRIACVALAHDAIGLALTRYPIEYDGLKFSKNIKSLFRFIALGLLVAMFVFNGIYLVTLYFSITFVNGDLFETINGVAALYLGASALIATMPSRFYAIAFEAAGRVYSAIGLKSASNTLVVLADDLRRASPSEANPSVVRKSRPKVKASNIARRKPSKQTITPYRPSLIEQFLKHNPGLADLISGILMLASGTIKLSATFFPFKSPLTTLTQHIDALVNRIKRPEVNRIKRPERKPSRKLPKQNVMPFE